MGTKQPLSTESVAREKSTRCGRLELPPRDRARLNSGEGDDEEERRG